MTTHKKAMLTIAEYFIVFTPVRSQRQKSNKQINTICYFKMIYYHFKKLLLTNFY